MYGLTTRLSNESDATMDLQPVDGIAMIEGITFYSHLPSLMDDDLNKLYNDIGESGA